jgi:DNA-binding FrmR family transcriptional regulator
MKKNLKVKKTASLKLARQAHGTLDTVVTMIEDNVHCPDIIQQTESVIGLLRSAKRELLASHLDTWVTRNKMRGDKSSAIKELLKIYNLSS